MLADHIDVASVNGTPGQPFPLIVLIRAIRAGTPTLYPTVPLRWARRISKDQQTILDSDDSWVPSLAGRTSRWGTIPVEITEKLIKCVDHAQATVSANSAESPDTQAADSEFRARKPDLADDEIAPPNEVKSVSNVENLTIGEGDGPRLDRGAAAAIPQDSSDDESEPATIDASEWSTSPPRSPKPVLPPDTSPPRPVSVRPTRVCLDPVREDEEEKEDEEQVEQEFRRSTTQKRTDMNPAYVALPQQKGRDVNVSLSHNHCDRRRKACNNEQLPASSTPARNAGPISQPCSALRMTAKRLHVNVQVKETPWLPKGAANRHKTKTSNDVPPSSIVVGTYPERPSKPCEEKRACTSPAAASPVFQARSASLPRITERCSSRFDTQSNEGRTTIPKHSVIKKTRGPTSRQVASQEQASISQVHGSEQTTTGRALDVRDERLIMEAEESQPNKRRKLNCSLSQSSEDEVDSAYCELDLKRVQERRNFRKAHNKVNPRSQSPVLQTLAHAAGLRQEISSLVSPPAFNPARDSGDSGSDGTHTAATTLSLHNPEFPKRTCGRRQTRQPLLNVSQDDCGAAKLYTAFKNAYPNYFGNENAFKKALQLLLRLEEQHEAPHPFMWDDFIYRMADDYKNYLQACMDECGDALPYNKYYHERIYRPQRLAEVVTKNTIQGNDAILNQQDALNQPDEVDMIDAYDDRAAQGVSILNKNTDGSPDEPSEAKVTIQETQACLEARPQNMFLQHVSFTGQNGLQAAKRPDQTQQDPNKRRSLPWNVNSSHPEATPSQSQGDSLGVAAFRHSASAKVKTWLSRSLGDESPELGVSSQSHVSFEPVPLPPQLQLLRKSRKSQHLDESSQTTRKSPPPLPELTTRSIGVPAMAVSQPAVTCSPVTASPFVIFARNYSNLQSEQALHALSNEDRMNAHHINIFSW